METSKPAFWIALTALVVAGGCFVVLLINGSGSSPAPDTATYKAPVVKSGSGSGSGAAPGGGTTSQGAKGTTGATGVPEDVVAVGPAGPRGKAGDTGPAGDVGSAGAAGSTGPQGCEGPAGPSGPVGETGAAGCQGPSGAEGAAGAAGAAGPAGPQGIPGADGKTILNGSGPPTDPEGAIGDFYIDTASSEIYGPKAKDGWGAGTSQVGPEGPQGEAGPQGAAGSAGKSVLSGSGVPASSLGSDGDFYIDTSANQIYGPKASGAWGVAVSLVGPQGPVGATGSQGPQGVQGPPGVDAANVPLYRGAFYSTGDQSPTGGTNVVPINLNETDISQGVELVSPGTAAVKVVHAGTYNFQFSAQVTKNDSGTDVLYIWPQVDPDGAGADYTWQNVSWANSGITLFAKDDRAIPSWNFVLPVDSGAYFRMVMSSTNTGFSVDSTTSPPIGPSIPGLLLTVTRAG